MHQTTHSFRPYVFLSFLVGLATFLAAQSPATFAGFNPRFDVFTLPGGAPGNAVQSIAQDSIGYLWFASQNGLHRFDGQTIQTFHYESSNPHSLSSDYCESIYIDSRGVLWITHFSDGGLTTYDPASETFTRYRHETNNPNSLSDNTNAVVVEDREGFIWIGGDSGLDRLDRKTGKFVHFRHDPKNPRSLSHDRVRGLYVDRQGTLWVATGFPWGAPQNEGGLNRYDPKTASFTQYLHDPKNPQSLIHNKVRAMLEDSRGNFWIGTAGDGLHLMNREAGTFTPLTYDANNPGKLTRPFLKGQTPADLVEGDHIASIFEDREGRIWICGFTGGLNVYDPVSGITKHFELGKKEGDLTSNRIWGAFQTKDGTLWLYSGGGGEVYKVKVNDKLFSFFNYQLNDGGPQSNGEPSAIAKDSAGNIWMGFTNEAFALCRFDRKSAKTMLVNRSDEPGGFDARQVYSLGFDKEGGLWVSTEKGLFRRMPLTGQFRHYLSEFKDTWVGPIAQDKEGFIWVPSWNGLFKLDPVSGTYSRFSDNNDRENGFEASASSQPRSIYMDGQGKAWISGGGFNDLAQPLFLDSYNIGNNFTHHIKDKESGSAMNLTQDAEGNIWFVDNVNGLQKFNPTNGSRKRFIPPNMTLSQPDALRSVPFVMDKQGKFWLFADNKLFEFNPKTAQFYTYGEAYGVHPLGNKYSNLFAAADGEILINGQLGLLSFYPENIGPVKNSGPDLKITSFRILGHTIVPVSDDKQADGILKKPIWQTHEVRLQHDQNMFAFTISCFDFNGMANQIEFMLEGFDRTGWRNDLLNGETPPYINVPPGEYVFRVRGSSNFGTWKEGKSLKIIILPPWWDTWWAWSIYIVFFFGIIFFFYNLQLKRHLQHAETLRLQELDAVKTRLYTNITHEFRTPLTVILGMAQLVLENPKEHFRQGLNAIIRNGDILLNLVNQMLDLSKLESGKLQLNYVHGNIVHFIKYLVESFHSLADGKGIRLHFLTDFEELQMDFDEERMQQVLSNLLSNAMKFTPASGHIYLDLRRENSILPNQHSMLILKVKDTGIGIAEEHLPHIFDRFYQADGAHTYRGEGTGIGLALTKELVKLMEGEIFVKSMVGNGTEFTVKLPIRNLAKAQHIEKQIMGRLIKLGHERPIEIVQSNSQPESPLVLIAEDNADVVAYIASCLSPDYRLAVANNGQEAVELALQLVPDLLVTDVMMPQRNGFEVCDLLKNDERTSHIPVIMLTAKADLDSKIAGLEKGADVYLSKPFEPKELLAHAKSLLELREKLQRYYRTLIDVEKDEEPAPPPPKPNEQENYFLKKVRKVVDAHLDDTAFTIEQMCQEVGISHAQLHRKLVALTGLSATMFLRTIRLNKAKELLLKPELSITSVAMDAGFNDLSYFGKVFKQEFGLTPNEWRQQQLEVME